LTRGTPSGQRRTASPATLGLAIGFVQRLERPHRLARKLRQGQARSRRESPRSADRPPGRRGRRPVGPSQHAPCLPRACFSGDAAGEGLRSTASKVSSPTAARSSGRSADRRSPRHAGRRMRCDVARPEVGDSPVRQLDQAVMSGSGCTTTSKRSYGRAGTGGASITSEALFISVAESIVILPPSPGRMPSACLTVTSSAQSRERPRKGPPLAVIVNDPQAPGGWPASSCEACARSHRHDLRSVASARAVKSSPPTTSDSLSPAPVDAPPERRHGGPKARLSRPAVQHEIGARLDDHRTTPRAAEHLPPVRRLGGERRGALVHQRFRPTP